MDEKKAPNVNQDLIGQEFVQFGEKHLHYPSLLKGYLSMRSANRGACHGWPRHAISFELKCMLLDLTFKSQFDQDKYNELVQSEKELFDRAGQFAKLSIQSISRMKKASDRERGEMIAKFEIMKGELLAGNDSKELIKKLRNLLIEMKDKKYIALTKYNSLMHDILNCI
jgi:hypothetical protein